MGNDVIPDLVVGKNKIENEDNSERYFKNWTGKRRNKLDILITILTNSLASVQIDLGPNSIMYLNLLECTVSCIKSFEPTTRLL